ncbi:MAG: peroxiredoxin [Neomegalonema sp.]|nr:peroxiredoxin [Neomegalonema sp.]
MNASASNDPSSAANRENNASAAIEVGAPFPDFDLPRDGGERVRLSDLAGRKAVIYFYPKDDTKGCTVQAEDFTAQADDFSAANIALYGVSKDSVAKHDKFIAKRELRLPLLSDEESDLCERCGVWVQKSMYGKKYMGIERTTFLIDEQGVVRQIWRKVKASAGHAQATLEAAKALNGG